MSAGIINEPAAQPGKRRKVSKPNEKKYLEKYDAARREVSEDRWAEQIAHLPQGASVYLRGVEQFTDTTGKVPVIATRRRDVRICHNRGKFVVVRGEDACTVCSTAAEALAQAKKWSDNRAKPEGQAALAGHKGKATE